MLVRGLDATQGKRQSLSRILGNQCFRKLLRVAWTNDRSYMYVHISGGQKGTVNMQKIMKLRFLVTRQPSEYREQTDDGSRGEVSRTRKAENSMNRQCPMLDRTCGLINEASYRGQWAMRVHLCSQRSRSAMAM